MTEEPRCVIDSTVPCRACSAPGPDQCPYRYLLGWTDEPGPQGAGTTTARPVISPAASSR
jgi:hypothetical protein